MLTGSVEISQTKCVCSQDKLRLAWIENLGLYQLEISIRRQRSCGCRAKMLVCLQDLSLRAARNNSKKLDLSLECMLLASLESAGTDLILAHMVV